MNKELLFKTYRNVSGAALYVFLVSQVMQHGNQWFGKEDNFFTPVAFLLLFSLSAAVMASLIFGLPAILLLDGKKKDGILAVFYSIGWLGFYTILGLLILILI